MRHVDDGTLHAWLDEELPSAEAGTVAAHLDACSACRARLGDARDMRDRAAALLEIDAPAVDRPPFDRLVALADARSRAATNAAPVSRRLGQARGWVLAAGWAASVALAAGLGWAAREMTTRAPQAEEMTIAADQRVTAADLQG
jgi:anti-sigma factor RsiW